MKRILFYVAIGIVLSFYRRPVDTMIVFWVCVFCFDLGLQALMAGKS